MLFAAHYITYCAYIDYAHKMKSTSQDQDYYLLTSPTDRVFYVDFCIR